jgi:pimeloyl-ACP methyl ester carboxylesterase
MATFVLVHGGGHGGWCYQRVSRLLSKAGHEVYAPTMTGVGERSHLVGPHVDLNLHIQDIAAVLHYEDLRDVILVGHSYGGMVITGVAGLAPDRVGKLVYLDAANPRNGESLVDVAGPVLALARQAGRVVDGVELVQLPSPEAGTFYGVTDPADLAWMAARLTRPDGRGPRVRPAVGHRDRARPHDHRAAAGHRRAGRGGRWLIGVPGHAAGG